MGTFSPRCNPICYLILLVSGGGMRSIFLIHFAPIFEMHTLLFKSLGSHSEKKVQKLSLVLYLFKR